MKLGGNMGKSLKLEVYSSKQEIQEITIHRYELTSNKLDSNKYKTIRSACGKLKNCNSSLGIFEDGNYIYSLCKIENIPSNVDFSLEYKGEYQHVVQENRGLYGKIIEYYIKENIRKVKVYEKYYKYRCKDVITSSWFWNGEKYGVIQTQDKSIKLARKFSIRVEVKEDNRAYLWIMNNSEFISNDNIANLLEKGINVKGMYVKNDWSNYKQSGVVINVDERTVVDKLDFTPSLKYYYENTKKQPNLVKDIRDDTPIINVEMDRDHKITPYYPQALKPIITREYLLKKEPIFSKQIEAYVKLDMKRRIELDKYFIEDIGIIEEMNRLSFHVEPCDISVLGFKPGRVEKLPLFCGNNRSISSEEKYKVYNFGFYQKPKYKLKIGYLYPRGYELLMKAVANEIYMFCTQGMYQGNRDPYIKEELLEIQGAAKIKEEYDIGSITDYKRAANKLKNIDEIDLVLAIVPNEEGEDNPYDPFKKVWAQMNIPSQMISMETAKLFQEGKKAGNRSKYYLQNIVLGILGKTGGTPWIIKNMPGDVDCFVGLDVATMAKGIHYPACSVVFDKYGRLINFFKPKIAQQGEKIQSNILQEIFDEVILSYEAQYGEKPRNIVIHRDGFSNEDSKWYEYYFKAQGISYTIVEIRKNTRSKLLMEQENEVINPPAGYCVYNEKKAYLVTTDINPKLGSPNPILIEKVCGDIGMPVILKQILSLTQLHVGSIREMRLPITTGYADKICKNLDFVQEGKLENRLFFL